MELGLCPSLLPVVASFFPSCDKGLFYKSTSNFSGIASESACTLHLQGTYVEFHPHVWETVCSGAELLRWPILWDYGPPNRFAVSIPAPSSFLCTACQSSIVEYTLEEEEKVTYILVTRGFSRHMIPIYIHYLPSFPFASDLYCICGREGFGEVVGPRHPFCPRSETWGGQGHMQGPIDSACKNSLTPGAWSTYRCMVEYSLDYPYRRTSSSIKEVSFSLPPMQSLFIKIGACSLFLLSLKIFIWCAT